MQKHIDEVIVRIGQLPADWHAAGTVDENGLRAIAEYAAEIGPIDHSVETGSGMTTLLFSHLSSDHRVFAVDAGDSISQVRRSPLFRNETVTYIEGPTQLTLPTHKFEQKVQIALIDGPHGYPFPDLEYYYFYPLIETGGLLLVDDIPIPTIRRMFEIIKADPMFELLDVINDNMAFFRRTSAPLVSPTGDGWWLQGYNRSHYEKALKGNKRASLLESVSASITRQVLRGASAVTPDSVKERMPKMIKRKLWKKM